jgi:hypothetical protein
MGTMQRKARIVTDTAKPPRRIPMRQILYISSSTLPGDAADLAGILCQSRHNNAIDGVTGLLWSDGARFVQVFEGPEDSVAATWARIRADPRHAEIRVLQDRVIPAREFGDWTMAMRRAGDPVDAHDIQVRRLLDRASPAISEPFLAMIAAN